MIVEEIQLILDLFEPKVPDRSSNRLLWSFCEDQSRWPDAHDLHSKIRVKNLEAIENQDKVGEAQYCFEEVIAKTLYNFTNTTAPFDSDSPYWIIKNALSLARYLGIPSEKLIEIIT